MDFKLILASGSPRRHQLMCDAGFKFEVKLKQTEEVYPADLEITKVPEYLAVLKAAAFNSELRPGELLITADTVVCLGEKILGKPQNREHAIEMLHELSGKKHTVVTGVCLMTTDHKETFSAYTDVYFIELTDQEITWYVDNYKPFDKAGAYGIQEWIGYIGINRIEGSFYNVMGLPVQQLCEALKHFK